MPSLAYLAKLDGGLAITETSAITILDQEAAKALREAAKIGRAAIRDAAPVGATRVLKRSHGYSVRRTGHGHVAQMTRKSDAWYGRVVEMGRKAGWSPGHSARTRQRSRHGYRYPAARANPYVQTAANTSLAAVEKALQQGNVHAAHRIAKELFHA